MRSEREILEESKVIAVVGCSNDSKRDSNMIAAFLVRQGYKVYPVNPTIDSALGMRSFPDVRSIPERVDIVNVFRRPDAVPAVVEDAIAAGARTIWLQLGVSNDEAEQRAASAGLEVVSELCIAVEYRILGIGRRDLTP